MGPLRGHALGRPGEDGQVWFYDPAASTFFLKVLFGLNPTPDVDGPSDGPDNITVAPWGGLILAEDGEGVQHLVSVTEFGESFPMARNDVSTVEFTGPVYSEDNTVLFADVQEPGTMVRDHRPVGGAGLIRDVGRGPVAPMRQGGGVTTSSVRLRAPAHHVDPRAMTWWRLQDALFWAVPLLAGGVFLVFWQPAWLVVLEVAVAVLAAVDLVVSPRIRYARHRYETTDVAVYVRDGVFVEDWRVAPLSRVQTVDTKRGPLQQWLGLSTVTVTTASTAGELKIKGLDRDEAAALVERLTAATEATPGDAT